MRAFALVCLAAVTPSCGADPCSVTDNPDGTATIKCPDGTSATVSDGLDGNDGPTGDPGQQGAQGPQGAAGAQGAQGQAGVDGVDGSDGADGVDGQDGAPGTPGTDGADGQDGAPGTPGQDGADGQDGAPGQNGADGIDNHIVASHFCSGAIPSSTVWVVYSAALTAAGDVFVRGSVYDEAMQASGAVFYAASQAGALTAQVTIVYDQAGADNYGYWTLELNRTTLVTSIEYHDSDVSGGALAWAFLPAACSTSNYP